MDVSQKMSIACRRSKRKDFVLGQGQGKRPEAPQPGANNDSIAVGPGEEAGQCRRELGPLGIGQRFSYPPITRRLRSSRNKMIQLIRKYNGDGSNSPKRQRDETARARLLLPCRRGVG